MSQNYFPIRPLTTIGLLAIGLVARATAAP